MCVCVYVCVVYFGVYAHTLTIMIIAIGNGINEPSSNPGGGCWCFTSCYCPLGKTWIHPFSLRLDSLA